MKRITVGDVVKREHFSSGWDEEFQCLIVDENAEDQVGEFCYINTQLLDYLEPIMSEGGVVLEHHTVDFFPERWFDLVLVLRCDNTILFDRLTERGYSLHKVQENVECEIMQTILDEARESYDPNIVQEIRSETYEDLEQNVSRVAQWLEMWKADHVNE
ncbi:uncharacterized protein [Blastocystis hominis]|uniref:Adenylate kinase isoenzyme 6 homolog n=1 Tax=Blastocystis hominis TaxID=12968 RepID=D8M1R0_BLAHO|nr:uncharacterized protein [Blastocystis hominis]CBK21999.2 unnamed protein product [Blastocystis hominis]|eukprot:XP_012896047.1 uncharacterized protein [Blastocystis hominis]